MREGLVRGGFVGGWWAGGSCGLDVGVCAKMGGGGGC